MEIQPKSRSLYKSISLLFIGSILCSCSSMNSLTIPVTEPAPVFLATTIQTIGVINRSVPSEENERMDQIDKILSVEGVNLDKEGAQKLLTGLLDELEISNRFIEAKIIDIPEVQNPALGVYPSELSWSTIENMCRENEVDAIFALSFYDTDTKVDYKAVPVKIVGPLGMNIPAIEHHATTRTFIKTGWRIYDPINKYIADEFVINDEVSVTGIGINPMKAVEAIVVGRKKDILHASNGIGHTYALRLVPYRRRVNRDYYVKGTGNFETAKRRAQTGNWDGAAELWELETSNPKAKLAGRAYYNMAIINEINGQLDIAIDWASKSYTDYRDKKALSYLNVLKRRVARNKQLEQQMMQEWQTFR